MRRFNVEIEVVHLTLLMTLPTILSVNATDSLPVLFAFSRVVGVAVHNVNTPLGTKVFTTQLGTSRLKFTLILFLLLSATISLFAPSPVANHKHLN